MAPLCRVGRPNEPVDTGGTAQSRASGFLTTEACTPRGIAAHLVKKHRLKRLSETITSKAGRQIDTTPQFAVVH